MIQCSKTQNAKLDGHVHPLHVKVEPLELQIENGGEGQEADTLRKVAFMALAVRVALQVCTSPANYV